MSAPTLTHDDIDNTTAVPVRKRALDGETFYSSHSHCYAVGRHAATKAGREMCRVGSYKITGHNHADVTNVKSKISNVVHATVGPDAQPVCDVKLASRVLVSAGDFPVTCKRCLKLTDA